MKKKFLLITGGTGGHVIPAKNFAYFLNEKKVNCRIMVDKRGYQYLNNFDGKIQVIGPQFTEKLLVYDLDEHQNQDRSQSITYSTNSINIKASKNKKHILEKFNTTQYY